MMVVIWFTAFEDDTNEIVTRIVSIQGVSGVSGISQSIGNWYLPDKKLYYSIHLHCLDEQHSCEYLSSHLIQDVLKSHVDYAQASL